MSNSVLTINVNEIKNNIKSIRKKLFKDQKLCAVVKANCYGLGARKICKNIDSDVDYFAVSCPQEFYAIRKYVTKPILILSPVYHNLKRLIKYGAELSVCNFESLFAVCKMAISLNIPCKVHVVVNTGMNRFGFKNISDFKTALRVIEKTQNISAIGVFSHYFQAENEDFAKNQYERFLDYAFEYVCESENSVVLHLSATSGIRYKNAFDMVRVGIGLYSDDAFGTISLTSKVLDIQVLKVGESAGYDGIFVAKKQTKIAVVGIGYADGISRIVAGKGYVLFAGKKAKIVAVCMDSILVDVTGLDIKICDIAVLIGKSKDSQIFVCDIAKWCGTISYEILTRISARVKRKYIC